jgi:hypothetical protein
MDHICGSPDAKKISVEPHFGQNFFDLFFGPVSFVEDIAIKQPARIILLEGGE